VIVPYGDDIGSAFANVRRAAAAIGGGRLVALTLGDRERPLPIDAFRWRIQSEEASRRSSTR